jgi:hypothetical protein
MEVTLETLDSDSESVLLVGPAAGRRHLGAPRLEGLVDGLKDGGPPSSHPKESVWSLGPEPKGA